MELLNDENTIKVLQTINNEKYKDLIKVLLN